MKQTSSPIPGKYIDRFRLDQLKPAEKAIQDLRLPLVRYRKLNGILNALKMQIEDGGDNPDVNAFLIQALRSAVIHQVGADAGQAAIRSIEAFQMSEEARWKQIRDGNFPAIQISIEDRFIDQIQIGYQLLKKQDFVAACQDWVQAWEIAKTMALPEMRTREEFVKAYPEVEVYFENWCYDFMFELHNAGVHDPKFYGYRLQYVQEFLSQFPDEDEDTLLNFGRGQGEALWGLGKHSEAEAVYTALVERLPDEAWAYIGWADQYWLMNNSQKQYDRAEAIMQQALKRSNLKDRGDLCDRLAALYNEWGKPEKSKALRLEEKKASQAIPKPQVDLIEQKAKKRARRGRRKKK